jgi:formamidopyrimidine-DNA glycosylase
MPELPEVETTRRGIAPHIEGAAVEQLIVRQPKLRWLVPDDLPALIAGKTLLRVDRRAKYLLLRFDSGSVIVHLGMSGSLRIIEADEPPAFHDHVDLVFNNGRALRYTDPRRFGCVLWQQGGGESHELLSRLGPEPLTEAFDGERLYQLSRKRRSAVKTFIMDNATVVGVGNIYANEALFAAGIRPSAQAGKISRPRYQRLADEIKKVLANAIEQGGTTLRDFVGGDGKPGYFKQSLAVYGRGGQPCVSCQQPLQESRLGQRSTVFCRHCQRY